MSSTYDRALRAIRRLVLQVHYRVQFVELPSRFAETFFDQFRVLPLELLSRVRPSLMGCPFFRSRSFTFQLLLNLLKELPDPQSFILSYCAQKLSVWTHSGAENLSLMAGPVANFGKPVFQRWVEGGGLGSNVFVNLPQFDLTVRLTMG